MEIALENLSILAAEVNYAKGNMTNDEFIAMCRAVVRYADSHTTNYLLI